PTLALSSAFFPGPFLCTGRQVRFDLPPELVMGNSAPFVGATVGGIQDGAQLLRVVDQDRTLFLGHDRDYGRMSSVGQAAVAGLLIVLLVCLVISFFYPVRQLTSCATARSAESPHERRCIRARPP